jgi:NAD(P)-dependent dehydrogenase (short-subunit alcohol dehydrogenase family)
MVGGRLRRLRAGIKQVEADLGPVDVLVNNAGITRDGMFHKMTKESGTRSSTPTSTACST